MLLRRISIVGMAACLAVLLVPSIAAASFRLRVDDLQSGKAIVLTDNGDGILTFMGVMPDSDVTFGVTIGNSKPLLSGSQLRLTDLTTTANGTASLLLTLEDTDYTEYAPGPLLLQGHVSGTPVNALVTAQTWANSLNSVPDLGAESATFTTSTAPNLLAGSGVPAGSVAAFTTAVASSAPSFSQDGYTEFAVAGPRYSLFSQMRIDFGAGGGSVNAGIETAVTPIPEPGTLSLFGTGLLGLGRAIRRRRLAA
jgi:hypothetical protein